MTIETASGEAVSLDRSPGGLRSMRRARDGSEQAWTVLGASRGESGILGEGVRQALLRDPTYLPALRLRAGVRPVSAEIRVAEDPAAEVAELLTEAACAGGTSSSRAARRRSAPTSWPPQRDADWSAATVWFTDERCVAARRTGLRTSAWPSGRC